jgi:hypothetical protein
VRAAADRDRIDRLLVALGRRLRTEHTVYLAGGASAVIEGWRGSTLDIDLRPEPDSDEIMRALSELKEELDVNLEPASPLDFLPELGGWRERSPYLRQLGPLHVRQMDFRLQALAKLERASDQDLQDVLAIIERRLVTPDELRHALGEMEAGLYRFPAVDRASFVSRASGFIDAVQGP